MRAMYPCERVTERECVLGESSRSRGTSANTDKPPYVAQAASIEIKEPDLRDSIVRRSLRTYLVEVPARCIHAEVVQQRIRKGARESDRGNPVVRLHRHIFDGALTAVQSVLAGVVCAEEELVLAGIEIQPPVELAA